VEYWAYLSYAHVDEKVARWLHRRIESYRVPGALRGTEVAGRVVGPRLRPLFRDRDELASSGDLRESLEAALEASTALIVLCTPAAARSKWVDQEIDAFVACHGRRRIFPLIVEGEPNSGGETECFPPALRGLGAAGLEPVAGDLRSHADGRRDGVLKAIAGLLEVGFDAIKRRDAQRRHRTVLGAAGLASLVAVVTTVMAVYAIQQRDIAHLRRTQAEDLIGFMLGDLRTRLREVGRLDVLDAVGDQAETYFAALPASEVNDHALEKQALALRQIGEVRLQQGQHEAAQRAFSTSLAQFEALVARKPGDASVLFERSQAEFWVGASYYRALQFDRARPFWERYSESARQLVALEPDNPDYRIEEAYALSNFGSLAVDQGNLATAQQAFAVSGEIFAELVEASPDDPALGFESAANDSWLGAVAEARFDWPGAAIFRRSAAARHAEVSAATGHPFHRRIEAEAWIRLSRAEFYLGRVVEARDAQQAAIDLYADLSSGDPENLEWRMGGLSARVRMALLEHFQTAGGAESLQLDSEFDVLLTEMLKIAASDPENGLWSGYAGVAGLDLASARLLAGDRSGVAATLAKVDSLIKEDFEAALDDSVSARRFFRLAVLEQLAGGRGAENLRSGMLDAPHLRMANKHLAALLAHLSGDADAAVLESEVRAAGFASPEYIALLAMARR